MSTPILGPLQNGTRLQFTMEYDLPQSVDASYGDIIITDSLPSGLAWYGTNNSDHKNKVMVGRIQQIIGIVFSVANNIVTIKIPNSIIAIAANQGQKLYVEIDAVISDASLIQPNTVITNNANLNFTKINLSGNGSTDFIFAPLNVNTTNIFHDTASPYSGTPLVIVITFTASSDTRVFNYDIMCDFGENLVFNPQYNVNYGIAYNVEEFYNEIHPITVKKDQSIANAYHFIFANNIDIAGSTILCGVFPETKYDEVIGIRSFTVVPEYIGFKYSIQIGGAQSEIKPISIPVAGKIRLRKSVVGVSPEPPVPQPIILIKNVVTR